MVAKFNLGKKYKYAEHTEKLLMVIRQKRIVLVIKKTQTGNIEKNKVLEQRFHERYG